MSNPSPHIWKFFRTGGIDQVALETAADLLNLGQLDQKLWVALSCPVKGLELDEKTLALIDGDGDGRIRVPELLAAISWTVARVKDANLLLKGDEGLPLATINDSTSEGKILLASARQILANVGKKDAAAITVADAADTAQIFSASSLNGDGIMMMTDMFDPNGFTNVNRKDIESIENSKVSPMPEGLLNTLQKDEILDLLAYLLSGGQTTAKR